MKQTNAAGRCHLTHISGITRPNRETRAGRSFSVCVPTFSMSFAITTRTKTPRGSRLVEMTRLGRERPRVLLNYIPRLAGSKYEDAMNQDRQEDGAVAGLYQHVANRDFRASSSGACEALRKKNVKHNRKEHRGHHHVHRGQPTQQPSDLGQGPSTATTPASSSGRHGARGHGPFASRRTHR